MKSYPFTSQVTYDEQGLPLYDRAIDSSFLRKVFAQYFSDGVFYKPTTALQVTVDTGMQVKVLPGSCHIQGAIGIEEAERTLTVQASETQDRIDTVVARLNLSLSVRTIDLYIVKGVAAMSPVAPALTRNATVWELGLANIFVAKNTATITQQRITDTRLDDSRCGLVAQTIGDLDTTPYFDQVQAIIKDLEDTIAGIEGGSGFVFSVNGESGHVNVNACITGEIKLWATDNPPEGYLLCNGQAVSRVQYAALFAVIGTIYGAGDGSSTFALPDLRGRVAVGKNNDTEFSALGKAGGEKAAAHSHGSSKLAAALDVNAYNNMTFSFRACDWSIDGYRSFGELTSGGGSTGRGLAIYGRTDSTAASTLQPYITLNYIIKY